MDIKSEIGQQLGCRRESDPSSRQLTRDLAIRFSSEPTEPKTRDPELGIGHRASLPQEGESDGSALQTEPSHGQSRDR
jgi:hypothetical protein